MRHARLIPLFVSTMLIAVPLRAQWQATADAGVARLRQTGIAESNALTFGANAGFLGDFAAFQSGFLATRTPADRWTAQGQAVGSLRGTPGPAGQLALTALLNSFAASNELPTVSAELLAQAKHGGAASGVAVGFGAGAFSHNGASAPLLHAQANAWQTVNVDQFLGEVSLIKTRLVPLPAIPGGVANVTLSYADFSASWRREYSGLSFGAVAGFRAGIAGLASADGWATFDATAWFAPHAAIVASAGRTLEDAVRGVPRTQFLSVAIRIAARPQSSLTTRPPVVAGAVVAVERAGDGRQRIEVRGVNGSRVELMADFTNWNPIVLARDGPVWRTEQAVTPGLHRLAIRIDDGEWIAPANLPRAADDLGGVVGLITIP